MSGSDASEAPVAVARGAACAPEPEPSTPGCAPAAALAGPGAPGGRVSPPILLLAPAAYGAETGPGAALLRHLRRRYRFPERVGLLEASSLQEALDALSEAELVLVLDGVAGRTGALYRFRAQASPPALRGGTAAGRSWATPQLLAAAPAGPRPEITVIAVGVGKTGLDGAAGALGTPDAPDAATLAAWTSLVLLELARGGVALGLVGADLPEIRAQ